MGCLVKADIQGNKIGFWSDTISVQAEQLEAENRKKRSKITKTAFSRVDVNARRVFQVRVVKWSIPEIFCFINQFCNSLEPGRFSFLGFSPKRHCATWWPYLEPNEVAN